MEHLEFVKVIAEGLLFLVELLPCECQEVKRSIEIEMTKIEDEERKKNEGFEII